MSLDNIAEELLSRSVSNVLTRTEAQEVYDVARAYPRFVENLQFTEAQLKNQHIIAYSILCCAREYAKTKLAKKQTVSKV